MRSNTFFCTQIFSVTALLICPGLAAPFGDETNDKVRRALEFADQAAAQGRVSYLETTKRSANQVGFQVDREKLRQRYKQQGLSEKDIQRKISMEEAGAKAQIESEAVPTQETLIYSNDQRFARTTIRTLRGGRKDELTQVFDGEDELLLTGKNDVMISAGKPTDLGPSQPLIRLFPGACSILGRGLSRLKKTVITSKGNDYVITGEAPDGTLLKATVDARNQYLARNIERRDRAGHLIGRTELGTPVRTRSGAMVPGTADYTIYRDKKPAMQIRYVLKEADFTTPDEKFFSVPLRQGMTIADLRLGAPVVFHKKSPGLISKKDLLKLTASKVEASAKVMNSRA